MADRNPLDLDPALQPLCQKFIEACGAVGIKVGVDQTYRSKSEQDADYAEGRDANGNVVDPDKIITCAKGGESPHNCVDDDGKPAARAFDFFIYASDDTTLDWDDEDPSWQKAIRIGEAIGLISGSKFPMRDYAHMELPNWKVGAQF
jgi:peptidoglycan LD-endopeptidase CwlK